MQRAIGRLLAAMVLVAACAATPPPTAPTPTGTPTGTDSPTQASSPTASSSVVTPTRSLAGVEGWRVDIAALVPGMNAIHPRLDHGVSLTELNAAAGRLSDDAPTLTDDQLLDGVMSIAAMVSRQGCDAHTGAYVWGSDLYPVDSMPLKLWWFDDGIYIVDALDPYHGLIGDRITTIAGKVIDDAIARLDPVIPRDNEWTVRLLTPRYLLMPQALSGVGVPAGKTVTLGVVDSAGAAQTVDVESISIPDYNSWAGPYGLLLPADTDVLYLSRQDDDLWWQKLDKGTLYVQYNEVAFVTPSKVNDLRDAVTGPAVKSIVFDLRNNTGGEVRAMDAFVSLFSDPDVQQPDRLFVVTGRNTFSAASMLVARLKAHAQALVVGEPMSGCPTTWGNGRTFNLPVSHIDVSVASQLEVGISETDTRPTIEPDIPAALTVADWAAHEDPVLAAISDYLSAR